MKDLKMNYNSGLGKVIIIYDSEKNTFSVLAQNPSSDKVDYLTVQSGIKDAETAKLVERAYFRGIFDGEDWSKK